MEKGFRPLGGTQALLLRDIYRNLEKELRIGT